MTGVSSDSAGRRFRSALEAERPLQIAGTVNAYSALLAERAGFRAIYLSGAGVANASLGIPDQGATTLEQVAVDASRVANAMSLPLLVDADTGWEEGAGIGRTIAELIGAGAAGLHLEDQVSAKKCGHLPGKRLVTAEAMVGRIAEAVKARANADFVIMARTDAVAVEGMERAIDRARRYRDAGAEMIFAEALPDLKSYERFVAGVKVPVLANITEFGKTPLFTVEELREAGVRMVLYPLSAFRAMSAAARTVYQTIRAEGTQKKVLPLMQTRAELYEALGYDPGVKSSEGKEAE